MGSNPKINWAKEKKNTSKPDPIIKPFGLNLAQRGPGVGWPHPCTPLPKPKLGLG